MSENLIHVNVAEEISFLADMAGAKCSDFQHQIVNSKVAYTAPTEANVFSLTVPENFALVITALDIKTLYNTADAALVNGDYRSTDDLNPYGPYVGAGAVGTVRWLIGGQQYGATTFDIGSINAGLIIVVLASQTLQIAVNPLQPAGKNLTLVSRLNVYLVPQEVGTEIKKGETQFIVNVP